MNIHREFIRRIHSLVKRSDKAPDFVAYVATLNQDLAALDSDLLGERVAMYLKVVDSVMNLLTLELTTPGLPEAREQQVVAELQAFNRMLRAYRCGRLPGRR